MALDQTANKSGLGDIIVAPLNKLVNWGRACLLYTSDAADE